jgi:hypothetical protein
VLIQERLGLQATMTPGRSGQYEVLVDGEVIATRAREIAAIRKKAARLGLTVVEGQA